MNWHRRYAAEACIFCRGYHTFTGNTKIGSNERWTPENGLREGLPRPWAEYTHSNGRVLRYQVPAMSYPGPSGPSPDDRAQVEILQQHRCPMCRVQFLPDEHVVRWKGLYSGLSSSADSDTFPFHIPCMDNVVKRQCPHFNGTGDPGSYNEMEDYEEGPYQQLRNNAEVQSSMLTKRLRMINHMSPEEPQLKL